MEELRPGDPRRAGRYELIARLGSGGMGHVFLGRSPGGRPVAVKVIRAELLAGHPDFRARFAREVAAARQVNALFTAPLVDADPDAEMPWLVTAYVPGPSLADAVDEHGPMPAAAVRGLAAGLAEGLAAIHAAGVVHRDLKPSNVLLASDGPRIIDFGISRAAEATALTATGAFVGTPAFMCPEQAEGKMAGPAGDIFSLGSVLTFAATGRGPFTAGSVPALFFQVVTAEPDLSAVPAELSPIIGRCLAKDPARRPAASGLVDELGYTAPGPEWLPLPVARTLGRYQIPLAPATQPPPAPLATDQPGQSVPSGPAPPPRAAETATVSPGLRPYLPPPPGPGPGAWPAPGPASQPAGRVVRPRQRPDRFRPPPGPVTLGSGPLPPACRFGWLSLPLLLLVATAAFTAPLETFYLLTYGAIVIIAVSRVTAAVLWIRTRGPCRAYRQCGPGRTRRPGGPGRPDAAGFRGLGGERVRGAAGRRSWPGGQLRQGAEHLRQADPFGSAKQAAYFLHLFLLLPALVVTAVVLLRSRAALRRPLLLPRVARALHVRGPGVRFAVAAGALALAVVLIGLNGGARPGRLPSGPICVLARATCGSAAHLHRAR